MKSKTYIIFICIFYIFSNTAFSQEKDSLDSSEIIDNFKSLDISYLGTTQNCTPYNVYAIRYKKSWILAVTEEETFAIFITSPPRSEEKIFTSSHFFNSGVSKIISIPGYLKKKQKRKTVNDIDLYGYYKPNRKGKKALEGLFLIEIPDIKEEPTFFLWKFFNNLFSKSKEKLEDNPIKKNINEKVKSAEEKVISQKEKVEKAVEEVSQQ